MMRKIQLILLAMSCLRMAMAWTPQQSNELSRRSAVRKFATMASGILSSGSVQQASAEPPLNIPVLQSNTSDLSSSTKSTTTKATSQPTFDAYYITPDESSARSKLNKIDSHKFLQQLASSKQGGAVWLGEHHNSAADHDFQATFIQQVHKQRKKAMKNMPSANMAIGLEQVQQEFQPVLDSYIAGKISLEKMRFMTQWDKRWTWSFDNYKSIFETARQLQIPLLALNVDSEDLILVEKEGYPGLPKERLRKYIKDP
jgi:uncharacterized iron-regulated protein